MKVTDSRHVSWSCLGICSPENVCSTEIGQICCYTLLHHMHDVSTYVVWLNYSVLYHDCLPLSKSFILPRLDTVSSFVKAFTLYSLRHCSEHMGKWYGAMNRFYCELFVANWQIEIWFKIAWHIAYFLSNNCCISHEVNSIRMFFWHHTWLAGAHICYHEAQYNHAMHIFIVSLTLYGLRSLS